MPAPSDAPDWALNSTFTVDGDTWGGDANKSDPGAGRIAEGFEPVSCPVEWMNWILNNHGAWAAWLEAERARLSTYCGNGGIVLPGVVAWERMMGAAAGEGANWVTDVTGAKSSTTNSAVCTWDLTPILHREGTINKVRVLVDPGVGGRLTTARMLVTLKRRTLGTFFTNPVTVTDVTVASVYATEATADPQWVEIDLAGTGYQAVHGGEPAVSALWTVNVQKGADTTTDRVLAIEVDLEGTRISNR